MCCLFKARKNRSTRETGHLFFFLHFSVESGSYKTCSHLWERLLNETTSLCLEDSSAVETPKLYSAVYGWLTLLCPPWQRQHLLLCAGSWFGIADTWDMQQDPSKGYLGFILVKVGSWIKTNCKQCLSTRTPTHTASAHPQGVLGSGDCGCGSYSAWMKTPQTESLWER